MTTPTNYREYQSANGSVQISLGGVAVCGNLLIVVHHIRAVPVGGMVRSVACCHDDIIYRVCLLLKCSSVKYILV